jgi:hypothetical protein
MKLKIRLRVGSRFGSALARNRELASVAAALLTPAAVGALALGVWRLSADLKWAGEFAISRGLFSHWQVWIAVAGVLQTCASILNRYGRGGGVAVS